MCRAAPDRVLEVPAHAGGDHGCRRVLATQLRGYLGLSPLPLNVFVSLNGELNPAAAVFGQPNQHVVVATTERGRAQVEARLRGQARCACTGR